MNRDTPGLEKKKPEAKSLDQTSRQPHFFSDLRLVSGFSSLWIVRVHTERLEIVSVEINCKHTCVQKNVYECLVSESGDK